MNMQDQEPSVSDILSSIRQILSDKIETEANASVADNGMPADNCIQLNNPAAISDEDVFVLTSQMRVSENNTSMQNEQRGFVDSNILSNDKIEKTVRSVSQPVYDSQSPVRPVQEEGGHNFDSDVSPVQGIDIKPMVQDWLDKNLPQIVEKIVSEEVRRIFNKR